jgi:hypothetical protein
MWIWGLIELLIVFGYTKAINFAMTSFLTGGIREVLKK